MNSISDGLVIADKNAVVIWINDASLKRIGITREKIIGRSLLDLEKEGVFQPSITRLVLEQKKPIEHVQYTADHNILKDPYITFGYPLWQQNAIVGVLTHSRHLPEIVESTIRLEEAEALLQRYHIEIRKARLHKDQNHNFYIGKNPSIIQAVHQAEHVAPILPSVLITGDAGTGKTHLAKYVHNLSPRHHEPFVNLNCSTIPESHIDAEIFGYYEPALLEMGSKSKAGLIDLAHGGFLFLDEIENLPLSIQAKLLHFLLTQRYLPIGAREEKKADVKIIVATNKNLKTEVESGRFRADLYYRLNVFPIELLSLRKRKEDITGFLQFFFEKFNHQYQNNSQLSSESINLLLDYDWPGNIRELENFCQRMVLTYPSKIIESTDLPKEIINNRFQVTDGPTDHESLTDYLDRIERGLIQQALNEHKTTRNAADSLKVTQSLLMRRIIKFKLNQKDDQGHSP